MTVVMQFSLSVKYFKPVFKDFKVFTGLWLHNLTTSTGGQVGGWVWVACLKLEIKLSQPQLKLKLSLVELRLSLAIMTSQKFSPHILRVV